MEKSLESSSNDGSGQVPVAYWEELALKDITILCNDAEVRQIRPNILAMRVLATDIEVDISSRRIWITGPDGDNIIKYPFKDLLILVYLLNVTPFGLKNEMVSVHDLKDAHFFQGPHQLKIAPLLERFGHDLSGFAGAAKRLGATPLEMADAAFEFRPFPKVPLYYLLWTGDEEFPPNCSILFDRSIEKHLSADAVWGVVNMISEALLTY